MEIPELFLEHMKILLGDEFDSFVSSLNEERSYGFRTNPLKIKDDKKEQVISNLLGAYGRVPWAKEGYYYDSDKRPGKTVWHEAGAIYIQEPSAMSVTAALDPKPGERILDLCAAPGGKSTHIAGRMQNKGVLVSNEIVQSRAKILSSNIERMGIRNCIVTSESPDRLANYFCGYFHKAVVDAPCSGEGMFRKEEAALEEWSEANVNMCAERQSLILDAAASMIMPGGLIVYSTCTFEPSEDEEIISEFVKSHDDWFIEEVELDGINEHGHPEWMNQPDDNVKKTLRLWPHKLKGEGHFLAKLRKRGSYPVDLDDEINSNAKSVKVKSKINNNLQCIEYINDNILAVNRSLDVEDVCKRIVKYGDNIYLMPKGTNESLIKNVNCLRPGLHIATALKNRIEPAHSLAISLTDDECRYFVDISESEAVKYIRGESVNVSECAVPSGQFVVVGINGISIGLGKIVNGVIKNHYPKGLRKEIINSGFN